VEREKERLYAKRTLAAINQKGEASTAEGPEYERMGKKGSRHKRVHKSERGGNGGRQGRGKTRAGGGRESRLNNAEKLN